MSDMATISIVAMLGWLVLAGASLASYRMSWGKMVQMALIWLCIFSGGFLIASFFM